MEKYFNLESNDSMVVRMVYQTKVTDKYQITIPKDLREIFGIRKGKYLTYIVKEEGLLIKCPKRIDKIAEKLYGLAKFKEDAVKATKRVRSDRT